MSGENHIVVCAQCGAKNRIPAERWGESAKCGRCRAPLSSADRFPASIIAIADRAFETEVLRFPGPVLLEFWAPG